MHRPTASNPTPDPRRSRRPILVAALGGLAAAVAAALPANAQSSPAAPIGTFSIRMNGGPVQSVQSFAEPGAAAGTVRFMGSAVDPGGTWEASWDYVADLDPNGNAKLTGNTTVKNKAAEAEDFEVKFRVPVCPFIQNAAKMGGACTVKIVTDANGGAVSTVGPNSVFAAMIDDVAGPKLFYGPFNMGSTGAGTAETANLFGAPFPGMNVSAVTSDFGVRHLFTLTDGDMTVITSNLVLGGDPSNYVACAPEAANQQAAAALPAPSAQASAAPMQAPAEAAVFAAPPMPEQASTGASNTATKMASQQAAPAQYATPVRANSTVQPMPGGPTSSSIILGGPSSDRVMIGKDTKKQAKKAPPPKKSSAQSAASKRTNQQMASNRARSNGNSSRR